MNQPKQLQHQEGVSNDSKLAIDYSNISVKLVNKDAGHKSNATINTTTTPSKTLESSNIIPQIQKPIYIESKTFVLNSAIIIL